MRFTHLSQWLAWQETLHPKAMDLSLERVRCVADRMHLLIPNAKLITIAGTNGKGSCAAFISTILAAQGYKLGVYTSPHLLHYSERIQIMGLPVSDSQLCNAFAQIDVAREDISLTYFEFGTLAAFYLFKQAKLDLWILEVGLGGRLDAVNILDTDIAIITSIDLDHMQWLGWEREAIGYEKAGIIRPYKPIVYGDTAMPKSISKVAASLKAEIYSLNQAYFYSSQGNSWSWWDKQQHLDYLPIPHLLLQNAAAALMAINCLAKLLPVDKDAIKKGLQSANLTGRFQIIPNPITTILDVAHNPAATLCLKARLEQQFCLGKTYAVVGMLADKDIAHALQPLLPLVYHWYLADLAVFRGATGQKLADVLRQNRIQAYKVFHDPKEAYRQAISEASQHDRIIVFGSFHTVGAILEELSSHAYLG